MKKALFLLSLLGTMSVAHADVAWEHRGTIKLGNSKPMVYFSLKNEWSDQKHRTALAFDATRAVQSMIPANPKAVKGTMQVIERLDDDRILFSSDLNKSYIDEPYRSLKSRLRLNFWEALGSNLSATDVPELTLAQRQRLGQEIRSVIAPFTRKIVKTYFRALPEKRTINGMNSRGYRYTTMINTSGGKGGNEWLRFASEWWLADEQGTDTEVRSFIQSANKIQADAGGLTASMWLNEMMPIYWEAAPQEAHQAMASLVGEPGSQNYGFQGTPMQFYMTISPPPMEAMAMGGDVRVAIELSKRDTASVDQTVFDAPTGYKKIDIEPFLGMARNMIKRGKDELEKAIEY